MFIKQIVRSFKTAYSITNRNFATIRCKQKCLFTNTSKLSSNKFHTSQTKRKVFVEHENTHMYSILNNRRGEPAVTATSEEIHNEEEFNKMLDRNWRMSNATDIVNTFINVKTFCINSNIDVSDTRFDQLVDGLMDHGEKMTDLEMENLLQTLSEYPLTPTFKSHNFHDIWSCLDDICCWRIYMWDTDTRLKFAMLMYKLNLGKVGDYVYEVIDRTSKKAENLTKDQMVQIFFLLNICRKHEVDFYYEHALEKIIPEMDVDEVAVITLGYFKTQTKIKLQPIFKTIIEKVIENSTSIHEITLTAILKCLRYSYPYKFADEVHTMLDKLLPEMDRFSEICCLHMALIPTALQTFHKGVLQKTSEILIKYIKNKEKVRVKDIERLLNVLTMFEFHPKTDPEIFQECFKEIHSQRREEEFIRYPRCLISALNYLSIKNIYSYQLMDKVLENEFILETFGKSAQQLPRELLVLNNSIDIECPNYDGNRLTNIFKYKGVRWNTIFAPDKEFKKLSLVQRLLADIIDAVTKIIKDEKYMIVDHVLPHFPVPDVILCKNRKTGEFIEPPGFENYVLGDVKFTYKDENLQWFSIVAVGQQHTIRNSFLPLGIIKMKERQLEKIGYTPILVSWYVLMKLTPEEKVQYMSRLIT